MIKKAERNLPQLVGFLILMVPSLIFRFGGEALRFKSKAHRAGRIFRKELVQQGLDKSIATQLTAFYQEGSDPFKLLKVLR
jgi:hypothetical protein